MTRRSAVGTAAGLGSLVLLTLVLLPFRSHLNSATTALVLVIPVVVGVIAGGFLAGVLGVVAGFLVYDLLFITPYLTLGVGAPGSWVPLGVYVVVMVPISRVVAGLNTAKAEARRQGREIRELFEISHLLVEDQSLDALLKTVVTSVAEVFGAEQVALLLPREGRLEVAASTGAPLSEVQLRRVLPAAGELATLGPRPLERDDLREIVLVAAGRPIGLLVLSAAAAGEDERELLLLFANHIALAVERVQLRDRALQARLAEEVARLAKTLVGAVSHDLRAPLTRIKASSSTLADRELALDEDTTQRLAAMIDTQADRLADLVQNLLDMSRIQAGVLEPRRTVASLADLVATVVGDVTAGRPAYTVRTDVANDLPPIDADLVLITRVLTNLLENAFRYSPKNRPVTVAARPVCPDGPDGPDGPERVEVTVTDHGPGIGPERRQEIFELFARREADAGAGLGLAIAKTFVDAHGQRIWVDEAPGGGAAFHFTLAVAEAIEEEPRVAADTRR